MYRFISITSFMLVFALAVGCSDQSSVLDPMSQSNDHSGFMGLSKGAMVANGWYEEEEIYYIDHGVEEGVTERGENDIYLIGGNRAYQAQVVEFIPGESGYSPHWNAQLVHTAEGITTADIAASPYASDHYPEALFDDVADILAAESAGLVEVQELGVVVLCPVVSEEVAEAPGNTELSEDFPRPWPDTF